MIGELTWNRNIRYTSVKSNRTSRIRTWNSFQNERFSLWSQVQTPHMTLIINGSIKTHTVRMRLRMQDRTVLALRLRLSIEILCLSDSVSSPDSEYGFKNSRMHLNPHPPLYDQRNCEYRLVYSVNFTPCMQPILIY